MRNKMWGFVVLAVASVMAAAGTGAQAQETTAATQRTGGEAVGATIVHPAAWNVEREPYTYEDTFGYTLWYPDTGAAHDHGGTPALRVALAYELDPRGHRGRGRRGFGPIIRPCPCDARPWASPGSTRAWRSEPYRAARRIPPSTCPLTAGCTRSTSTRDDPAEQGLDARSEGAALRRAIRAALRARGLARPARRQLAGGLAVPAGPGADRERSSFAPSGRRKGTRPPRQPGPRPRAAGRSRSPRDATWPIRDSAYRPSTGISANQNRGRKNGIAPDGPGSGSTTSGASTPTAT